jgi:hypothetical protein
MKILACLLFALSSISMVLADIPPEPRENKTSDSGICAGALLFVVGLVILGSWILKKSRVKSNA